MPLHTTTLTKCSLNDIMTNFDYDSALVADVDLQSDSNC